MSAHVRRINRQDRIATGVLVGIAAFVMLMLAAIVIYILVAGAPKLFDLNFLTGKPQQFKEGGGIGPEREPELRDFLRRYSVPASE